MKKTKEYKGCELNSPLYRQVASEMTKSKDDKWCHYSGIPLPKRGKYS